VYFVSVHLEWFAQFSPTTVTEVVGVFVRFRASPVGGSTISGYDFRYGGVRSQTSLPANYWLFAPTAASPVPKVFDVDLQRG
jgi:hypothetical protein